MKSPTRSLYLRVPLALHAQVVAMSHVLGVSANSFAVNALERALATEERNLPQHVASLAAKACVAASDREDQPGTLRRDPATGGPTKN